MTETKPDARCVTLGDGSCVGVGCMHDPNPPHPLQVCASCLLYSSNSVHGSVADCIDHPCALPDEHHAFVRMGEMAATAGDEVHLTTSGNLAAASRLRLALRSVLTRLRRS